MSDNNDRIGLFSNWIKTCEGKSSNEVITVALPVKYNRLMKILKALRE